MMIIMKALVLNVVSAVGFGVVVIFNMGEAVHHVTSLAEKVALRVSTHTSAIRASEHFIWQASTATTATSPNPQSPIMSLVSGEKSSFQFILRLLNTNVEGKQKVMYALTKIKGVGRRYSNLVCKKADVDLNKRYATLLREGFATANADERKMKNSKN